MVQYYLVCVGCHLLIEFTAPGIELDLPSRIKKFLMQNLAIQILPFFHIDKHFFKVLRSH